ncbi:MAG: MBL fold metallo-hydrolase [Pseudomonadota bacterium]
MTLTVLADGNDDFPGAELFAINDTPERFAEVQAELFEPADRVNFHMNTLLVETGGRKILIDAGFGHFLGPRFGVQARALANAGVDPAEIDTVVITHGHADHFAGLLSPDLAPRFPNAKILWNAPEWDYWTSPRAVEDVTGSQLPQDIKDLFIATTQTVLTKTAPQVETVTVSDDLEIAPGLALSPAAGHTPHSVVAMLASQGRAMLYASDTTLLVQQNAIAPDWVAAFEYDGEALVKTRRRLLDRAASEEMVWFGYHAPFPALGRIARRGGAYAFVPSSWRWG